jgi:hypothetical protein
MVARRRGVRRLAKFLLAAALIATIGICAKTAAVSAAQVDPMPFERDTARLKTRIDERWRVIPLQGGLLLVPKRPSSIKGVELTRDGAIAIDGQTVTGADLQNRLGADADAVLRLSYLSPAERGAMFLAQAQPPADTEPVERAKTSGAAGRRVPGAGAGSGPAANADSPNHGNGPWTEVMPIARGDRFRFGGNATVDESEQVKSVTAVMGNANIDGVVSRDVVAIGGDVQLGPKAVVRGSVTAIGGAVHADPSARIDGQVNELGFTNANLRVWWAEHGRAESFSVGITPDWPRIARITFFSGVAMSVIWILLCAGALVIAPNAVNRQRQTMAGAPIVAFVTGIATELFLGPVLALIVTFLAVSVIGIPLIALVPIGLFALFLGTLFASTAVCLSIGERLVGLSIGRALPLVAVLAGGVFLSAVTLAGRFFWMANHGRFGWGLAFAGVGLLIEYVAVTLAVGGAMLSAARSIRFRRKRAAAAAVVPTESTETPQNF